MRTSAQVNANFSADIVAGCSPLVVNFKDMSGGNPSQWVWNLGNGTTSSLQNPTSTYFTPGSYNIKLVVKNASGADSIVKTQYVTVYANPVIAFTLSDSAGCFPKTIQFNDNSAAGSGSISQWNWDFGDGNISTQQNPVHTYTNEGSYNVTLNVRNTMGCQKTLSKTGIVRLLNPDAEFSFSTAPGCQGSTTLQFNDLSVNSIKSQWYFGDGNTSTQPDPVHIYAAAGSYEVKLVVESANGCKDSVIRSITVGAVQAEFNTGIICEGSPALFQNLSTPAPLSVHWDFGDGTVSTEMNPSKIYTGAGNYTVRLITDFGGCTDTITKPVVVNAKPSAAFTEVGDRIKCSPATTINFNALQPNLSYLWSFGDGTSAASKNPSHSYTTYGSNDVRLIVTNNAGCSDTLIKPMLVQVKAPEITGVSGGFEGCAPYTARFNATVSSIDPVVNWSWDFGDGSTSTSQQPTHLYSSPGIYNVVLVITTAEGCKDTFNYVSAIRISNRPVASFNATPQVTCAAGEIQFNNTTSGGQEYLWIFNDGGFSTDENPSHQFGDTGVFTITLIASSTGCRDTLTIEKYVRNDPPIGRFNFIQDCNNPYEVQFRDSSIGGQTYLWKFGDGDSSNERNPKHIYKAPGTYNIAFTVFHGSCSYPAAGTVTIIDEHPQISISDTSICRGTLAGFSAGNVDPANIASYHWQFGDNTTSVSSTASTQYQYPNNGKYYPQLVTKDKLGCLDTASNIIELNVYGPYAGFKNDAGVCLGVTAAFIDTSEFDGQHNIVSRTWDFGDGTISSNSSAPYSHLYQAKGIYDIRLTVKDDMGCEDLAYHPSAITVADPSANFVSSDSVRCAANTVSFSNSSVGLGIQFAWTFGDNTKSVETHPQHVYANEGQYFVSLTVTDQFGCKDSIVKKQVISNPIAKFIASDTIAQCPPLLVNLSNSSSAYTNTAWDFGDGSKADLDNPSHYYTYPGTYQLKLKTLGYGNCIDSATKTIIIKGPTGTFNVNPSTICANSSVSFSAVAQDHAKFLWDFSDGNTRLTTVPSTAHVYDMPGYYQPRMILIDTAGCEVPIVSPDTIKVMGVKAKIGLDKSLFCDSASVHFTDLSVLHNDIPASYSWSFGDGTNSGLPNPVHKYSTTGIYSTRLTITTKAGCVDSVVSNLPILVVNSPKIAITGQSSICQNESISFSGVVTQPDTSALQWNWNFSNGEISTLRNPAQSFDTDGTFTITAVATNTSGCTDTAHLPILVHPLPDVEAGTDTMICRGNTYSLHPTGAASYQWESDVTLSCTDGSSAVVNPIFNTVYYVTGTSQFGCKTIDSVKISVMQPFDLNVNKDDSLCAGKTLQLKANGAAKYNWYPSTGLNNASISNPVANPSSTTNYMVIGTDARNCFSDTGYVKVSVFPVPQFNIIENVLTLPAGTTATIGTTSSADVTSWKWYPEKDLSCTDCPQPVVSAKDNMFYRAEVKNAGGCTTRDEVTVSVICGDGNVFIPNTFSPNNDGTNDVFYPRGKGITSIKNMKVFNRWGELVYEKGNFSANDAAAGWNGSFKGSLLTPDVYVYIVDVVCYNSTVFTLKGNVTLIR